MVVACIALAVALGGTSYAAIKLRRNSVGMKQLQKNAVVASKLNARSVGPQKLQNNAVTARAVKDNQLTGAKIAESTLALHARVSGRVRLPACLYGWREGALGATTACRVYGEAVSG